MLEILKQLKQIWQYYIVKASSSVFDWECTPYTSKLVRFGQTSTRNDFCFLSHKHHSLKYYFHSSEQWIAIDDLYLVNTFQLPITFCRHALLTLGDNRFNWNKSFCGSIQLKQQHFKPNDRKPAYTILKDTCLIHRMNSVSAESTHRTSYLVSKVTCIWLCFCMCC